MNHWYQHFYQCGRADLARTVTIIQEHDFLDPDVFLQAKDSLQHVRHPVLWACTNPMDIDAVMVRCEEVWGSGGFFVLDWDAAQRSTADRAYWPCFLIEQRLNARQPPRSRQHRISMLSGRPRSHRLDLWCHIRDLVRAEDVVVINAFGLDHCCFDHPALADLPWSNHPDFLGESQDRPLCTNTTAIDHPAFRACVNITAETLGPGPEVFITEKTWKALAAGCMLWHWGCDGAAHYLADLGFRDWFSQTTSARDLFERNDVWDFYHANQHEVMQQLDLFWSSHLLRSLTQPALQRLDLWLAR